MSDSKITQDFIGFGLGLRTDHFEYILQHQPAIDWFEVLSENYMVAGVNLVTTLKRSLSNTLS